MGELPKSHPFHRARWRIKDLWLRPERRGMLSVDRSRTEMKDKRTLLEMTRGKVKFEAFGEEMLEKKVSLSGNSGRIYLPPDWVGHHVKIIRID